MVNKNVIIILTTFFKFIDFKISTEIPYIFNSKFSPQLSFSIYKQDSTFLNTRFDSKLFYHINPKIKLAATYNSESSENLEETINNNVETFNNFFLGFQFQYKIAKNDVFYNNKFYFEINPTIGKREIDQISSNQFKIEANASYIWDINLRNSIYIKNATGYLNSENYINNELFRIGGANSMRGFNEQSLFAEKFTYFNLEYRFIASEKSYLYTITDYGFLESLKMKNTLLGIGLGYTFFVNTSLIRFSSVIGKDNSQNFDTKNVKILIDWKAFF
jgi:hemolysin activation/secretion protein